MPTPKILVAGTGAVGGYFGAKLDQAGANVSYLARSNAESLKKKGMQVLSKMGDHHFFPAQIVTSANDYQGNPDFILITTKASGRVDLQNWIGSVAACGCPIVLLQNGIFIEKAYAEVFPKNSILGGIVRIGASRKEPGVIEHHHRGELVLGAFTGGKSAAAITLSEIFESGGVHCEISTHLELERWNKLVWNASFNPLSVILGGIKTDELIAKHTDKLIAIMNEILLAAKKFGCSVPDDLPQKNIELTKTWAPYETSMLQDFKAGRPLEIEPILGNLLVAAKAVGLNLPIVESCYQEILKIN
ncbi:MAG: 2-dehydropantoate 2-reductase [SAR324 cluster bacterium]|nr:2-dehydropantoate 2-reductase [SAR324 cluster bacterium]